MESLSTNLKQLASLDITKRLKSKCQSNIVAKPEKDVIEPFSSRAIPPEIIDDLPSPDVLSASATIVDMAFCPGHSLHVRSRRVQIKVSQA